MVKSGIDKQLDQSPRMLQAGFLQARQSEQFQGFSSEELDEIYRLLGTVYGARKLKASVQSRLTEKLSEPEARYALQWQDSPLGRKITKLEEESSSPEAFAESKAMADRLLGDASRVNLIRRLDRAFRLMESGMDASLQTTIALYTATAALYPQESRPTHEEIVVMAEHDTETIRPQIEKAGLGLLLYTYRSLSESEIEQYVAFGESARKYVVSGHAAINEALSQGTRELGTEIGKMLMKREQTENWSPSSIQHDAQQGDSIRKGSKPLTETR
jgi:hypothetical protein